MVYVKLVNKRKSTYIIEARLNASEASCLKCKSVLQVWKARILFDELIRQKFQKIRSINKCEDCEHLSDMYSLSTLGIGAAQFRSVTEIAPKRNHCSYF